MPTSALQLLRRARLALCILGAACLALPGCDNPACVFSASGCNGSTGGIGEHAATVPSDDEWIQPGAPTVVKTFPLTAALCDVHAPVVLVFSESMTPANVGTTPPTPLTTAFRLRTESGLPVTFQSATLIGNGQVLVLLPIVPLAAGTTYTIDLTDNAALCDLTGQTLARPASGTFGTFTTAAGPAATPKVLAKFPDDGTTNQGATTEIDVIFDRSINAATVDNASFAVTVDGNPPAPDPNPQPLSVGSSTDTRVFTWRCVDGQGVPVSLGEGGHVEVQLSNTGHVIQDSGGAALAATSFAFDIAPFSAPISAAITSVPNDAIGINEISGPADLAVQVQLSGAQSGDFLVLTMFGIQPDTTPPAPTIALRREVALTAPFDSFTMTAAEIDLLRTPNPVAGRFADGEVAFAFQVRRGDTESPIRRLDVDTTKSGVQNPVLDTTPPVVLGMGIAGGAQGTLRSDLRDVVLYGRASERVLKAEVVTPLGNNEITAGVTPPVVGSSATGVFVAAPVRLGVLSASQNPLDYTLTIYDRALNSAVVQSDVADPTDGFRQLGASGPGTALPGGNVDVEVFDAATLAPVVGASVYVHQLVGGTLTAVNATAVLTDGSGLAVVPAASAGTTLVTVDKAGYDLFTFQGVPTSQLGIPLEPAGLLAGTASGTVGPIDAVTAGELNVYTRSVVDSRRFETDPAFSPVATCTGSGDSFECPFGPISVHPNRIGAQSAITVLVPPNIFTYSALTYLKTAAIALPQFPVLPGSNGITELPIPVLLDAGDLDPEERPIDVPQHALSTAAWPLLAGDPEISVEATSPGFHGTVTVGQGVAFPDTPPDAWLVRAAYPGDADGIVDFPGDQLGSLVTQGTIDADLFIGVEVEDLAGNRGGARPRFSMTTLSLSPPAPPSLPANPITPNPGQGFDLSFPDVLPDAVSAPGNGIYRVSLQDSLNRGWTIYLPDPRDAGGPDVVVHLPDLAGLFPLASGSVDCSISAWSWPTFDIAQFLWTDIEREHDLSVHAAAQAFTLP